jgi:hypothetical protein
VADFHFFNPVPGLQMSFLTVTTTAAKRQYRQISDFVELFSEESVKNRAREVRKERGTSKNAARLHLVYFQPQKM